MLRDKVFVITGGAGLIGQSFVKGIVQNQGIAVIADIDSTHGKTALEALSKEMKTTSIDFFQLDITSEESLKKCIDYLYKKYKRIDGLVNNAYPRNREYGKEFFDISYESFNENINLNLGGYFLSSKVFAQYFKSQGHGNIVNIGSIYGVIPPRFEIYDGTNMTMPVEYAVIKSALIHLTKYMAKYFKGLNIRVNVLSPGGILNSQSQEFLDRYNMFGQSKGMLNSDDLVGSLVFLLSEQSKYINGQNLIVDDGWIL